MEKAGKLLSVIVPVYRVEAYIRTCLDSLVTDPERMERLEVLAVNDGTPDRSADIAREYAQRYPDTFTVIDQENAGHGGAWNTGLARARGKYVRFLDSDDLLENLPRLVDLLAATDADLVLTDRTVFTDGSGRERKEKIRHLPAGTLFSLDETAWPVRGNGYSYAHFHTCTYKRTLFDGEQPLFQPHTPYDDLILMTAPVILGTTSLYGGFPLYRYRIGRTGQTMDPAVLRKDLPRQLVQREYALRFAAERGPEVPRRARLLEGIVRALCKSGYDFILHLPADRQPEALAHWSERLAAVLPEPGRIPQYRWYNLLSPRCFRLRIKLWNLWCKIRSL